MEAIFSKVIKVEATKHLKTPERNSDTNEEKRSKISHTLLILRSKNSVSKREKLQTKIKYWLKKKI